MGEPMITVAGEALIDLIVDQAGHVDPRMGGGPFNVARAVARLGAVAAPGHRAAASRSRRCRTHQRRARAAGSSTVRQ